MNPALPPSLLAALAYGLAALFIGLDLARGEQHSGRAHITAAIAVLAHAWALFLALFANNAIDLNLLHAFSLTNWAISLLLVLIAQYRRVLALGAALFPLSMLAALALLIPTTPVLLSYRNGALDLHITLAIVAYASLGLAALIAGGLWLQERLVRKQRGAALLNRLPPLQATEQLLFALIGVGFAALSVALITGFVFMENMFAQQLVHKTVLSLCSWLVFAILLFGRWARGWRGLTAVRFVLIGVGLLIVAYFGSKFVIEAVLAA